MAKKKKYQSGGILPTAYPMAPRKQSSYMGNDPMQLQQNSFPYQGLDTSQASQWQNLDIPTMQDDASLYPYTPQNQASAPQDSLASAQRKGLIQEYQEDGGEFAEFSEPKKPKKPYRGEIGNIALGGLLALDALIPTPKPQNPVVRPGLSYNEHPFGTGSSALAKNGMRVSNSGYKANSPDRGYDSLRIPSNQITMQNVPHPVYGVDDTGYGQLMQPNQDYQFPGSYVDEYPIKAQSGKKIPQFGKAAVNIFQNGGNVATPPTVQRMDSTQIAYFNGFLDHVKAKGLQGSTKLNTGTLNEELYKEYQTANPAVKLPLRDLTRMAQNEQHEQKAFDVNFAQRKDPAKASAVANSSISKIDDFFGSETSKRYIPIAQKVDIHNNQVIKNQNLGYVPNSINKPAVDTTKKIPKGVEVIETSEGRGYFDPEYGNFVKLKNGGRIPKYKAGSTHMMDDNTIQQLVAQGYEFKIIE